MELPQYFICGHSSHIIPLTETMPFFNLMHDHGILRDIFLWLSTTEGKNIVKPLTISQTCQFQLFLTDVPFNF